MSIIAITDHFDSPSSEETEILGGKVGNSLGEDTKVLLVWHEPINERFLDQVPNLIGVQRYGVGYDNLDLELLQSKGIIACNNPDYGTEEVADSAFAMILNFSRGIGRYNHNSKKYFDSWQENIDPQIRRTGESTVGVIGAGRIGGTLLLKAKAFGFKTAFFDPFKPRGHEKMLGAKRYDSLEELLEYSDFVSIHTPLNEDTKGMVNKNFLQSMKSSASLINTARGPIFEDLDLLFQALNNNWIQNLGADVLPVEPPPGSQLIDAWRNDQHDLPGRLVINPHSSYYSQESYSELRSNAAKNALRILNGESPHNLLY